MSLIKFSAVFGILTTALLALPAQATEPPAARVLELSGDAHFTPVKGTRTKLTLGARLPQGATLETADKGSVKLQIADKSVVNVGGSTRMSLVSRGLAGEQVTLGLEQGRIRAYVIKRID